ncbi:MAG: sigma-70 family RNA polymerase sigma factor [Gemmatimonas sp.]|nr:sigma-70 family RNA polymerase sigma factor [Gemmatimonas sp.]
MATGENPRDGSEEPLQAEPDEDLARRVQRGERDAMEQLVRRYLRPIHAVAASYLSEPMDVEDAAQESFLRMLGAIEAYDPRRPFAPWLYQIARNIARKRLAARFRWREELPSGELPSRQPGPDEVLERSDVRARVDAAIARLPERQRTAFRLCDVERYPTGDVARIMGLSAGTVRSHVHHARRALRAALAEGGKEAKNRRIVP